eukprot:3840866-Pleurochrysis_carterae.AAC.1
MLRKVSKDRKPAQCPHSAARSYLFTFLTPANPSTLPRVRTQSWRVKMGSQKGSDSNRWQAQHFNACWVLIPTLGKHSIFMHVAMAAALEARNLFHQKHTCRNKC